MWWSVCWSWENDFREVVPYISFRMLNSSSLCFSFGVWECNHEIIHKTKQAARLFNWFWGTCSCKHENWWSNQCCSDIILTWVGEKQDPLKSLTWEFKVCIFLFYVVNSFCCLLLNSSFPDKYEHCFFYLRLKVLILLHMVSYQSLLDVFLF